MRNIVATAVLLLLTACPQTPVTPPSFDASDAGGDAGESDAGSPQSENDGAIYRDRFDLACAHLREMKCKEGLVGSCAETMRHGDGTIADYRPACVANSTSPLDLRASCGPAWKKGCR